MKSLKGHRTIIFGVLTMIGAALQASTGVLSPAEVDAAVSVIGAIAVALRFITDTPVGSNVPKAGA